MIPSSHIPFRRTEAVTEAKRDRHYALRKAAACFSAFKTDATPAARERAVDACRLVTERDDALEAVLRGDP